MWSIFRNRIIGISIIAIFAGTGFLAHAETIEELQSKISGKSNDISQLEKEIEQYQKELEVTAREAKTLQGAIKTLDLSKRKLDTDIKVTENKIDTTNYTIQKLAIEISVSEKKIRNQEQALINTLSEINELESSSLLEVVLSKESISEFWDDVNSLERVQEVMSASLQELRSTKQELEGQHSENTEQKEALVDYTENLSDQRTIVKSNINEKDKLLTVTKNKESNYRNLIEEKEALKKAFEAEVKEFEEALRVAIDPDSLPRLGSEVLRFPVDSIRITQFFGNTPFANAGAYNGNGHNGIDLGVSVGTPVRSASSGTVIGVGDTDLVCPNASYGKWVLVEHENGLTTLYAHLSLIKANQGGIVGKGDIIGYSGNTGYSTGPHLHFTVYASQGVEVRGLKSRACNGSTYTIPLAPRNAYLNPLNYLEKY